MLKAKDFVGADEWFVLLLGDHLYTTYRTLRTLCFLHLILKDSGAVEDGCCLEQLLHAFEMCGKCITAVGVIPIEEVCVCRSVRSSSVPREWCAVPHVVKKPPFRLALQAPVSGVIGGIDYDANSRRFTVSGMAEKPSGAYARRPMFRCALTASIAHSCALARELATTSGVWSGKG